MSEAPFDYTFTVFTPTYNRAHTLHRVYESLQNQTFRDFEWLIIDDGSSDETPERVHHWLQENRFSIRYMWKKNQGINLTINKGVLEARGRFFLMIGSDDAFVPETLETFLSHWEGIPKEIRHRFVGVTALCKDQEGRLSGSGLPKDILDSDSLEIRYKFKVRGEMWGFLRTDLLRQFPFTVPLGVKYIPEGVVWNAIARRYKTRFINIPLRIYWEDRGSNSDQLTRRRDFSYIAPGMALGHQQKLNGEMDWFTYAPLEFLRSAAHFSRFSFHNRTGLLEQYRKMQNIQAKGLWMVVWPLGYLLYLRDRRIPQVTAPLKSLCQPYTSFTMRKRKSGR